MFYLYAIINNVNNKLYIGVTNNLVKRWKTHQLIAESGKNKFPKHFQLIHHAIKKYSASNFLFAKLAEFENEDACYNAERILIKNLKKLNYVLYNLSAGGKGTGSGINHPNYGKQYSLEYRNKISVGLKKGYAENPDRKQRCKDIILSRNLIGENHPMYGKKHSEETKIIISEKSKNKTLSESTKQKISKANKGKIVSEATKIKLSEIAKSKNLIGEKNPNYNNRWSNEQKNNLSIKKLGTINIVQRKFNNEEVLKILQLKYENKETLISLSKKYECGLSTIKQIVYGKYYQECYKQYMATFLKSKN